MIVTIISEILNFALHTAAISAHTPPARNPITRERIILGIPGTAVQFRATMVVAIAPT